MRKTEDAGDYGGTCDTCANGVAKVGHQQCPPCEQRDAEVDAHIDASAEKAKADALALQLAEMTELANQKDALANARVAKAKEQAEATLTALRAQVKPAVFALEEARRTISVDHPVRVHIDGVLSDLTALLADGATDPAAREPESA